MVDKTDFKSTNKTTPKATAKTVELKGGEGEIADTEEQSTDGITDTDTQPISTEVSEADTPPSEASDEPDDNSGKHWDDEKGWIVDAPAET